MITIIYVYYVYCVAIIVVINYIIMAPSPLSIIPLLNSNLLGHKSWIFRQIRKIWVWHQINLIYTCLDTVSGVRWEIDQWYCCDISYLFVYILTKRGNNNDGFSTQNCEENSKVKYPPSWLVAWQSTKSQFNSRKHEIFGQKYLETIPSFTLGPIEKHWSKIDIMYERGMRH